MQYAEQKSELKRLIQERIGYSEDFSDEDVVEIIDEVILSRKDLSLWPVDARIQLKKDLFYSLRRLDILELFAEDTEVTEIMVNGPDAIFREKHGVLEQLDVRFESMEKLNDVIQRIVSGCNRVINQSSPIVDARLADGSRVNVVLPPIALNGPILTIRRFPEKPITMEWLVKIGSISGEAAGFLKSLVQAGYNIFISGGTGSGKTTFLNALSQFISPEERIVTVEDSAELQLLNQPNLVRLETRNNNVEGCREITMRELIKTSLRMRPSRVIVGEVRGEEAFDMLQCMNTGHDGSMSTGHANSAKDMLSRLENMVLCAMDLPLPAIRQQIAAGIDILVHLGRIRDRSRRVLEILEITGVVNDEIQTRCLYAFEETGVDGEGAVKGTLRKRGDLTDRRKLETAGVSQN